MSSIQINGHDELNQGGPRIAAVGLAVRAARAQAPGDAVWPRIAGERQRRQIGAIVGAAGGAIGDGTTFQKFTVVGRGARDRKSTRLNSSH